MTKEVESNNTACPNCFSNLYPLAREDEELLRFSRLSSLSAASAFEPQEQHPKGERQQKEYATNQSVTKAKEIEEYRRKKVGFDEDGNDDPLSSLVSTSLIMNLAAYEEQQTKDTSGRANAYADMNGGKMVEVEEEQGNEFDKRKKMSEIVEEPSLKFLYPDYSDSERSANNNKKDDRSGDDGREADRDSSSNAKNVSSDCGRGSDDGASRVDENDECANNGTEEGHNQCGNINQMRQRCGKMVNNKMV